MERIPAPVPPILQVLSQIKKCTMPLQLLKDALDALNQIPNARINNPRYNTTYQLARAIGNEVERWQNNDPKFPNGSKSWIETHYEITLAVSKFGLDANASKFGLNTIDTSDLVERLTDEFEIERLQLIAGRQIQNRLLFKGAIMNFVKEKLIINE
jgi:hypothetical protein